jgi:hypothetical protein
VDEVITHRDVTTVMDILSRLEIEVRTIREFLLEEDDGEETYEADE